MFVRLCFYVCIHVYLAAQHALLLAGMPDYKQTYTCHIKNTYLYKREMCVHARKRSILGHLVLFPANASQLVEGLLEFFAVKHLIPPDIYIYIYMYMHTSVHVHVHIHIHIHIYIHVYKAYVQVCVHAYVHAHVYQCMYMYTNDFSFLSHSLNLRSVYTCM